MLKIKKDSTILCVLEKDFTVTLIEEIPENRVCFECRTLSNIEVTEIGMKMSKYDVTKLLEKFNTLNVETVGIEEVEKLESDILNAGLNLKKISKQYVPKFIKKIHNSPKDFTLDQMHIYYIDALFNKIFYESMEISEDDQLFFG